MRRSSPRLRNVRGETKTRFYITSVHPRADVTLSIAYVTYIIMQTLARLQ